MKIAFYMEDGLKQLVFTPENESEANMLSNLHDGQLSLSVKKGSFFQCQGGWTRYGVHYDHDGMFGRSHGNDESTMLVLRPVPKAAEPYQYPSDDVQISQTTGGEPA